MSRGNNNGFKVFIPNAQQKDVEHDWAKYMRNYGAKGDQTKSEYFFDNATIKSLGDNTVDVYSITTETKDGALLMVFFDLGGAFLSSTLHPDKVEGAENLLHQFAVEEAKADMSTQIADAIKVLETKRKEQSALEKQSSDIHSKVDDCKSAIEQAEKDLDENSSSQGAKKKEIEDQQKVVDDLKAKQGGIQ